MSAITPLRRSPRRVTPPPQRRPNLRVVPAARPRHTVAFIVVITLVFGAAVFATVGLNALAAGNAMTAHDLEQRVADSERRYAALVAEVAALEDPDRIREAALELGMVPAESPRYLFVHRALTADGAVTDVIDAGETTDPMKPVLSVQR